MPTIEEMQPIGGYSDLLYALTQDLRHIEDISGTGPTYAPRVYKLACGYPILLSWLDRLASLSDFHELNAEERRRFCILPLVDLHVPLWPSNLLLAFLTRVEYHLKRRGCGGGCCVESDIWSAFRSYQTEVAIGTCTSVNQRLDVKQQAAEVLRQDTTRIHALTKLEAKLGLVRAGARDTLKLPDDPLFVFPVWAPTHCEELAIDQIPLLRSAHITVLWCLP